MSRSDFVVLIAYYFTLGVLAIYSVHRLYLVRLRRKLDQGCPIPPDPEIWPAVAIQLPLFNEPHVAARVIDAAASVDYPGPLEIQVLDDSTDATSSIVAERQLFWSSRGIHIAHIRRATRDGFKAGALAHGMAISSAEFFAVFDADFVPPPQLLRQMVPHFQNADVGMVQARWGHLNRNESLLTRVQAIYLDGHFAIESSARYLAGRFFNFNGTAGIWRREAIESAGGWSAVTLTEDLDLSYRAQLAGWQFVFLPNVEVAAELPAALSAFHQQQHRWAKGSIQTARRILPRLIQGNLPPAVKTEAVFHLTNNSAYLLTVVLALLIVPAITIRQRLGATWTLILDAVLFALSTGSLLLFYIDGQRRVNERPPRLRELLAVMPMGIGISVGNCVAVVEGLFQRGGTFARTPKRGGQAREILDIPLRLPVGESVLAAFFAVASIVAVVTKQWVSLPFLGLFLSGYGWAVVLALGERLSYKSSAT